jgi:hypothetical protein
MGSALPASEDHPCAAGYDPPSRKGLVCDLNRQLTDRAPCHELRRYPWNQPHPTLQSQTMYCILEAKARFPPKKSRRPWRTTSGTTAGTNRRRPRPMRPGKRASLANRAPGIQGSRSSGAMTLDSANAAPARPGMGRQKRNLPQLATIGDT